MSGRTIDIFKDRLLVICLLLGTGTSEAVSDDDLNLRFVLFASTVIW